MGTVLLCSACKGKFRVGESVAPGSLVRCPYCSLVMSITGPVASHPVAAATPTPSPADDPLWSALASEAAGPLGPPRRKKQDRTIVYVVGGSAGALALILIAALLLMLSGGREVATDSGGTNTAAAPTQPGAETTPEAPATASRTSASSGATSAAGISRPPAESGKPKSPEPEPPEPETVAPTPSKASSGQPGSSEPPTEIASAAAVVAAPAAESVDLLKLIDPVRDVIGASWTRQGSSLTCPGGERWVLVVPKPPPAGYRWTLVVEAASSAPINLCLLVDGQQVLLVLDGYGRHLNGLNLVDGRTADNNATTRPGEVFHQGSPTTIVCTVNRSSVEVTCDGKPLLAWKGSTGRLSFDRGPWQGLPADRLAVMSYYGGSARIDKMEIAEIDPGEAMPYTGPPGMARGRAMRPPWADGRPWPPGRQAPPQSSESSPSKPGPSKPRPSKPGPGPSPSEPAPESPAELAAASAVPIIPPAELPEAVRRSKESVCIIEHPLGSGTGFVVGKNLVATNAHVVDGAYVEEIECHFSAAGATKCRASRVLFEDPVRDLCLLEVKTDQAPIPVVGDYEFKQGEKVMIVGNPALGKTDIVLRDAVTAGTLRAVVHTGNCDFYQIDGSVNSGSSGGPALNHEGAVVAVIAMKATERGETEIRQALRGLDDNFAGRFGTLAQKGIAFGIPVADLDRAIAQIKQQPESAVARTGDRHLANVLLQRMVVVAGINLLKLQLSVPAGVRQQAEDVERRIRLRQIPTSTLNKLSRVPLVPAGVAGRLSRAFEDAEFLKVMRACETGMEANVRHLAESQEFDPAIARNFEALLRTVLLGRRFVDNPPSTYNAYAKAVNDQADNLKAQIRRLTEQLDVGKAAYED